MDVQAAAPTTTILSPAFVSAAPPVQAAPAAQATPSSSPASTGVTLAAIPVVSGNDNGSSNSSTSGNPGSTGNSIGATPGLATLPAGPPDGSKKGSEPDSSLANAVGLLYNVQEQNIAVSFQIEQNPNEIVTVFTNKQTGKVIVQFPSETMIALAKLFDKLDGNVVNKKV
jgi:hypothetical protein